MPELCGGRVTSSNVVRQRPFNIRDVDAAIRTKRREFRAESDALGFSAFHSSRELPLQGPRRKCGG